MAYGEGAYGEGAYGTEVVVVGGGYGRNIFPAHQPTRPARITGHAVEELVFTDAGEGRVVLKGLAVEVFDDSLALVLLALLADDAADAFDAVLASAA